MIFSACAVLSALLMVSLLNGCSSEPVTVNGTEEEGVVFRAGALEFDSEALSRQADEIDPTNDSLVLVKFFLETNGPKWWKKAGWLNDPLEEWRGVRVELIDGEKRVVELRMGAFNIQGEIPEYLGRLSELRALDLKWNERLVGAIPEALYDLTKLHVLNLRMTKITGKLSPKIGNLTQLDTLNLRTFTYEQEVYPYVRNTYLMTGPLPKEIGQLTKLRFVDLGRQGFSGELPEELGNCTALEDFDIELCAFSGELPESLRNLKKLHNFSISYNFFTGEFPEWISELESIERIWMKYNDFEGEIPASIVKLNHLWELNLTGNRLSGELPATLGQMADLRGLSLGKNQFEGDFMKALAPLLKGKLYDAELSYNNFSCEIPDPAVYPTPLDLKGNRLHGDVPQWYLDRPGTLGAIFPQQTGYEFDNLSFEQAQARMPEPGPDPNPHRLHFPNLEDLKVRR